MARSDREQEAVEWLLTPVFGEGFEPADITVQEEQIISTVVGEIEGGFSSSKYPLGLVIDFALLAQKLATWDESATEFRQGITEAEIFDRYELVTTRSSKKANTLTLKYDDNAAGIRSFEMLVLEFFSRARRHGYPSAYVYNTGQWRKYIPYLEACFALSASGRYELCNRLLDFALGRLPEAVYTGRPERRVRLFEQIIVDFPRSAKGENAGLAWQAIAYGYACADRSHLRLTTRRVRAGAAGAPRLGDVDGFDGLDLEVSIEVKDMDITEDNYETHLGPFANEVQARGAVAVAFVGSIDDEARAALQARGVEPFTATDLQAAVALWDWRKQDIAVRSTAEFLGHIEQNPLAVERLLAFIAERDPKHDLLAYRQAATPVADEGPSAIADPTPAEPPAPRARRLRPLR